MAGSLRVAMLGHLASPDSPTGAERSLALLAEGLVARGDVVQVVVPGPWVLAPTLRAVGVQVVEIPCRVCWLIHHDPRPWPVVAAHGLRWALPDPGSRRLARHLARERPDVVHVNCLPHLSGAAVAHAAGLPLVWHLREVLPPGRRRRWFARRLAAHATRIVAVSEAVAGWLREEGLGRRVDVVPNGERLAPSLNGTAPAARARLGLPADGCLVGLYGRVLPAKGVLEFVDAAGRALARRTDLCFVIAGAGPPDYLRAVRARIAAGPVAARIHVLPAQPDAQDLIAAADVVSLTSTIPESFPRSVLEAMAAGRPVAAFRSGGTAEMVVEGETGLLVDPGDVASLADQFVALAADPRLRARLGAAGRARAADRFSLTRHVERIAAVLQAAVESAR